MMCLGGRCTVVMPRAATLGLGLGVGEHREQEAVSFREPALPRVETCAIASAAVFAALAQGVAYLSSKSNDWRLPLRPDLDPYLPGDQPFAAGFRGLAYPLSNTTERRA